MSHDATASPALGHVIDEMVIWFTVWHRLAVQLPPDRSTLEADLRLPESFDVWRQRAFAELTKDQPVIEKLAAQVEQLQRLTRLILMKTPKGKNIDPKNDQSVVHLYLEIMQGLRRCESAFNLAASGLDPLTGLRTRIGLGRELEQEAARTARTGRPFCLAMMDLDHFKKVNDTYGHDAGDRVLNGAAAQIIRMLRANDEAFRVGGEEFALCLKETDLKGGALVLERLRMALANTPLPVNDREQITVTASFGLAHGGEGATASEIMRRADAALYQAKHEGRNKIVVAATPTLLAAGNSS